MPPTDLQTFLRPFRTVATGEVRGSFSLSRNVGAQLTLFQPGRGQVMRDTFTACPTGFETLTAALTTLRLPLKTTLFHLFNCVIVCFVECRHIQITMNSNYTSYYEEIDLNRVSG